MKQFGITALVAFVLMETKTYPTIRLLIMIFHKLIIHSFIVIILSPASDKTCC